jgi:WD40 repeat protein
VGWFSPDTGGSVTVFDTVSGMELATWPAQSGVTWDMDFSDDGQYLVVAAFSFENGGVARLHDPLTGDAIGPLLGGGLKTAPVVAYDDSFGGSAILGEFDGGVTRWWTIEEYGPAQVTRHDGSVNDVTVSKDGRIVVSVGSDGMLRMVNTENLQMIGAPMLAVGGETVELGPDGRLLVWGGSDGAIRFWEIRDTPLVGHVGANAAGVVALAYSPTGELLASGDLNEIRLWDTSTREELGQPVGSFNGALDFSPDGRILAFTSDKSVSLWDVQEGRPFADDLSFVSQGFDDLEFSPDGQLLAVSRGEEARIWTTGDWRLQTNAITSSGGIAAVAFSPDGEFLVTGDRQGSVSIWDTTRWNELDRVRLPSSLPVNDLAVSPDGSTIAAATAGHIQLIGTTGFGIVGSPLVGRSDAVVFSPDSSLLASVGDALVIWDVAERERIGADRAGTRAVAISPDGAELAVASEAPDGAVRLWSGLARLEHLACEIAGRNLTAQEWTDFGPTDMEFNKTCPEHP